jgi:hypothetical protein
MKAQALLLLTAVLLTGGCERKTVIVETAPPTPLAEPVARTKTLETTRLGAAVDLFASEPTAEHQTDVKKALAELDGEIAELEALVAKRTGAEREEAAVKLRNLQTYRTAEVARFTAAQAKPGLVAPDANLGRTGAEKVEDSAKKVGESIEDAARKTGDTIKDAVR